MLACWSCLLLLSYPVGGKAQESADYYDYLTNEMGVSAVYLILNQVAFSPPDGSYCDSYGDYGERLEESLYSDKYTGVPSFSFSRRLVSDDMRYMTLMDLGLFYSKDGKYWDCPNQEWHMERIGSDSFLMDRLHKLTIAWTLRINTGKDSLDWSSVRRLPSAYARRAFNADTVLVFPLKVWKPYKEYRHCRVTVIQKNGRGCIQLCTFYTDEGEKELDNYLRSLEKMVWYRDPEDFLDFRSWSLIWDWKEGRRVWPFPV